MIMKTVNLQADAFFSVTESLRMERHKRNFSLGKLNSNGRIVKFVPIKHKDQKGRGPEYPGYYPINIWINLEIGDYILMAGDKPTRCLFYTVTKNGAIVNVPNPKGNRYAEG